MSNNNSTNATELLWQIAKLTTGALLTVAILTEAFSAIIVVANAIYIADGGASNGGYAFMLIGMLMAASIGVMPIIWWTFSDSAESQWSLSSSFVIAGLSLIGCAVSDGFGGASWSAWNLDSVVEGAAAATAGLTLISWKLTQSQMAASEVNKYVSTQSFCTLKEPPVYSAWEAPRIFW